MRENTYMQMHFRQYLVFSMTPICWLRSMSSINCFCSIFSLPTICLMNTCCSRSSTFGLSSKSLIKHLWGGGRKGKRRTSEVNFLEITFKVHLVTYCQCKYLFYNRGITNIAASITHLQMKSLKSSDQSSGWWRVGGGFLLKGRNGKDKWKDKMRWDLRRRTGEQKAEAP